MQQEHTTGAKNNCDCIETTPVFDAGTPANQRVGHRLSHLHLLFLDVLCSAGTPRPSLLPCPACLPACLPAPFRYFHLKESTPSFPSTSLFLHLSPLAHHESSSSRSESLTKRPTSSRSKFFIYTPFSNQFPQKAEFMSIENLKTFGKSTLAMILLLRHYRATPASRPACCTERAEIARRHGNDCRGRVGGAGYCLVRATGKRLTSDDHHRPLRRSRRRHR
jgi:hypothetical protein